MQRRLIASHAAYRKEVFLLGDLVKTTRFRGFLKWWYPTTMGFPTKNDHFGVLWDTTIYGNTHLLNKQIASQIPYMYHCDQKGPLRTELPRSSRARKNRNQKGHRCEVRGLVGRGPYYMHE